MRIAVVGASGRIGREVVDILKHRGEEIVEITRSAGIDVHSGKGLAAALTGVDVVVDAVNAATTETTAVTEFFGAVARTVAAAAHAAGVRRVVVVSIIGIDGFTAGHYAGKLVQERAYREGPVPVHIVRAAQFHEFAEMMLEWTTQDDLAEIPRYRAQLVSARTAAEQVAEVALAGGPDLVEIAGPQQWWLVDAVAQLVARRGGPARVREVDDITDPDHLLLAEGALLAGPNAIIAGPTFEEWLDDRWPIEG
ncbi:epimerase [Nocardia mangyaensis]|uniref:Epimerase n=1 Tax=Nocardia mangyaensis TaxID=2213200 RepID=A0A1J0VTE8_9NOCA|nr:NAD(P)H-binding protein [Nocardia mangyaensis]APE35297.1 epimerase [Nocardia mangyaensis]